MKDMVDPNGFSLLLPKKWEYLIKDPSKGDMPQLSFKDINAMKLALSVPTRYGRKPRLGTARELYLMSAKRISTSIISKHEIPSFFNCTWYILNVQVIINNSLFMKTCITT